MLIQEMADQFDVIFNNIASNQAPGCNDYEKSLFLTRAEKEITKNHFTANSKGNSLGVGFDDSLKRQADFSTLIKTANCTLIAAPGSAVSTLYSFTFSTVTRVLKNVTFTKSGTSTTIVPPVGTYNAIYQGGVLQILIGESTYIVTGTDVPTVNCILNVSSTIDNRLDSRSGIWSFPEDIFIPVNEVIYTNNGKPLQIIPLRYDEYTRLMSKPYKRPLKNQAWRLINSGSISEETISKTVEIIAGAGDILSSYIIRYVRMPKPIIVGDLGGLTIDGESEISTECELDPILHDDVVQRAVELAKIAWGGAGQDVQLEIASGQRSE